MKKYKRNIYILIFSICIYIGFMYLNNNFLLSKRLVEVCIINKDMKRGEIININDFNIIKVENNKTNGKFLQPKQINNVVAKYDLIEGQVINSNCIENKNEYISAENNKEIVFLPIKNSYDAVPSKLKKASILNIYFTGKTSQFENIIKLNEFENLNSSNSSESYTTIKILDTVKLMGAFDKEGNDIEKENSNGIINNKQIDTIMIETTKENAMMISNMKNYGTFNISILK